MPAAMVARSGEARSSIAPPKASSSAGMLPASFTPLACLAESVIDCSLSHFCRSAGLCAQQPVEPDEGRQLLLVA